MTTYFHQFTQIKMRISNKMAITKIAFTIICMSSIVNIMAVERKEGTQQTNDAFSGKIF